MNNLSQFVESHRDRNSRNIIQLKEQLAVQAAHGATTNEKLHRVQKEIMALRDIVDRLLDMFLHEESKPQQVHQIESRMDILEATYMDFQFVCKICDENFQNIELLENHSANYHNWNERISYIESKPAEQSKNIEPMSEMISHFEQTIVEVREELEKFLSTSNQPHICQYCDAEFSNKNEYQLHIDRQHNADTWQKCTGCAERICPDYKQSHSFDCLTIEISKFQINDDDITLTRIL